MKNIKITPKDKLKTLSESVKPYLTLIIVLLFFLNLSYMISMETKMKQIQEEIAAINSQIENIERRLLLERGRRLPSKNEKGILIEMSDKLDDIERKIGYRY